MNAGPACPIRFGTGNNPKEALADQCLTAAEIEWRRWSGWQMERTDSKQRLNALEITDTLQTRSYLPQ